jgi:hypothetical protein
MVTFVLLLVNLLHGMTVPMTLLVRDRLLQRRWLDILLVFVDGTARW